MNHCHPVWKSTKDIKPSSWERRFWHHADLILTTSQLLSAAAWYIHPDIHVHDSSRTLWRMHSHNSIEANVDLRFHSRNKEGICIMPPKVTSVSISDMYHLPNPFLAFLDIMIFSLSFLHSVQHHWLHSCKPYPYLFSLLSYYTAESPWDLQLSNIKTSPSNRTFWEGKWGYMVFVTGSRGNYLCLKDFSFIGISFWVSTSFLEKEAHGSSISCFSLLPGPLLFKGEGVTILNKDTRKTNTVGLWAALEGCHSGPPSRKNLPVSCNKSS